MSGTAASERGRIAQTFARLRAEGRAGLITFVMAGDPDMAGFEAILAELPRAGADLLEIGMPFSDPMADGPAIQLAGLRSLKSGTKLRQILTAVAHFRRSDTSTPIVLMGYFNPVLHYGPDAFARDAAAAGVDGLILVDLPPEEADEALPAIRQAGMDLIRLTTPTTDRARLPAILGGASGFIYHVAIAGVTGTRSADTAEVEKIVARIRETAALPIAVGFGIKTPEQAASIGRFADAVVVGSALVETIRQHLDAAGRAEPAMIPALIADVSALAAAIRGARGGDTVTPRAASSRIG